MQDKIERQIEIRAPASRVWRALVDHREFGRWFGVELDGPFIQGQPCRGRITHPGYEHLVWQATVLRMDPERLFSFSWHPYAIDPSVDYSSESPTVVEFHLEKTADGVLLRVIESGFAKLPLHRRDEAFRMNADGWTAQMKNIESHLARE